MKPRQFIVLVLFLVVIGIGAYVALPVWWKPPPPPPPIDAARLIAAVQAYSRDKKDEVKPIPGSLTLGELVAAGYLHTNEVVAFEGAEVTFLLDADLTRPREVIIRVRLRDGTQLVLLANGTAQQLPK